MFMDTELFEVPTRTHVAHWSEQSEKYATGEVLHGLLMEGARICGVVFMQEKPLLGGRRVRVYLVNLREQNGENHRLALIENPYVSRLLQEYGAQVIRMNWRKGAPAGTAR
ncbi:MAG: hypothetical protein U0452_14970 [Anaerolineae bacterium]